MSATVSSIVRPGPRRKGATKSARSAAAKRLSPCPVLSIGIDQRTHDIRRAYSLYLEASEIDESPDTAERAFELYNECIKLDPCLAIAFTNRANIHFRAKRTALAVADYLAALTLSPDQPEALYNLGYIALESGDHETALPLFKRSLQSDPTFTDCMFNLAMAYEQAGCESFARHMWQRYVKLNTDQTSTWRAIAVRHLEG